MVKNIEKELKAFWVSRHLEVNDRRKRSLLFGDYVVDRRAKAKELGFREESSCYGSVAGEAIPRAHDQSEDSER